MRACICLHRIAFEHAPEIPPPNCINLCVGVHSAHMHKHQPKKREPRQSARTHKHTRRHILAAEKKCHDRNVSMCATSARKLCAACMNNFMQTCCAARSSHKDRVITITCPRKLHETRRKHDVKRVLCVYVQCVHVCVYVYICYTGITFFAYAK